MPKNYINISFQILYDTDIDIWPVIAPGKGIELKAKPHSGGVRHKS